MNHRTADAALDALLFPRKSQLRIGHTPAHQAALVVLRTKPFYMLGGWFDQASKLIGSAEGLESFAYHGLRSSFRKTQGVRVKEGHGSKEEVSVGYGFNMNRGPDARRAFKEVGLDEKAFDDVYNGRRALSTAEATRLRENDVLLLNAGITRAVGRPLRDHQRAALVSLAYNTGFGGAMTVLNAVRAGQTDRDIAALITGFKVGKDGKLTNRRRHEASLWLGAQAEDFGARQGSCRLSHAAFC